MAEIQEQNTIFYNVESAPFSVHGIFYDSGKYRRMPENVALSVSEGVYSLHANTAGGRVRFKTNSPYIVIKAEMPCISKMSHFALTGSSGFDMYISKNGKDTYFCTFIPPFGMEKGYEGSVEFSDESIKDITINFPLYSEVSSLEIGLKKDAEVLPAAPYKIKKPIVYYGSSITQGGCASRPGMSYESIISRHFDCDYINLGFSGNAKAEKEIIDYIKKLDMSVFVYDYDHNAPTVEHLAATHEEMFREIRKEKNDLPMIIMPRPKYLLTDEENIRRDIVKKTYENAVAQGDRNVYYIDGRALMADAFDEGTVDNTHPTDLGFASMAKAVGNVIEKILQQNKL